jgi:hypothetical protein
MGTKWKRGLTGYKGEGKKVRKEEGNWRRGSKAGHLPEN